MTDISMCKGKECPLKEKCYRHLAKPNPDRQSFFASIPYKNGNCRYFWPVEKGMILEDVKGH